MAKLLRMRATTMAAFVFVATVTNALSGDANAAKAGVTTGPAEPMQVALVSLETNAYEAGKSKDAQPENAPFGHARSGDVPSAKTGQSFAEASATLLGRPRSCD